MKYYTNNQEDEIFRRNIHKRKTVQKPDKAVQKRILCAMQPLKALNHTKLSISRLTFFIDFKELLQNRFKNLGLKKVKEMELEQPIIFQSQFVVALTITFLL